MSVASTPPDQSSQPISPRPASSADSSLDLRYPLKLRSDQDRIKFEVWKLIKSGGTGSEVLVKPSNDDAMFAPVGKPPVILPIQSGITDNNTVDWGSGQLNELNRMYVNASLGLMQSQDFGTLGDKEKNAIKSLFGSNENQNALRLFLAEMATGNQGLQSRAFGSVMNPNLELLFQGPQLRPFNFNFKLSARNGPEAKRIKQIIKFFKENMAVKREKGSLFLKAPYVFDIQYQKAEGSLHPSINKIKKCALQGCSVDYTPLGTYMTYKDPDNTLVSYSLSLQFQEILPVYDDDYSGHQIGY